MLVFRELEITRSVRQRDPLARFFRSQSRWELLLLIAANGRSDEIGIWNYIDMLTTRTESPMTIYTFIRDRIDDGSLVLLQGRKKSRKVLALSPHLEAALNEFLTRRYILSAQDGQMDADRAGPTPYSTVPIRNVGTDMDDDGDVDRPFTVTVLTDAPTAVTA